MEELRHKREDQHAVAQDPGPKPLGRQVLRDLTEGSMAGGAGRKAGPLPPAQYLLCFCRRSRAPCWRVGNNTSVRGRLTVSPGIGIGAPRSHWPSLPWEQENFRYLATPPSASSLSYPPRCKAEHGWRNPAPNMACVCVCV